MDEDTTEMGRINGWVKGTETEGGGRNGKQGKREG